ncbi:MAG: ABC transporter permease, partial [Chloroflexota bacterium]|nr:ABC transporter permease [Chloroflexota bacterium]
MNLWEATKIAWRNLVASKLRSFLTMLGIIIGVASVIALMSVGRGTQAAVTSQIKGIGSNLLFVSPGRTSEGGVRSASGSAGTLTLQDAVALADPLAAPSVAKVAPELGSGGQVVYGGQNLNTRATGVTPAYLEVRNLTLSEGDFIAQEEVDARSRVAVVGAAIVQELFSGADPIGETININRVPFKVIGVLQAKGGMGNQDEVIYVPITTAQYRLMGGGFFRGEARVSSINVQVVSEDQTQSAIEEISQILRERHKLTYGNDDFTVTSQQDMLQALSQITGILTLFLSSIAAISLLVGGIGIMNIM